jgi:hypothetical protein
LPIVYAAHVPEEKPVSAEKTPNGYEVPVPKRGEFFANLKKVARVGKRSTPASGSQK